MSFSKKAFCVSTLYCTVCGLPQSIIRDSARRRPTGHIKHMYCFKCEDVTAHMENKRPKKLLKARPKLELFC